MRRAVLVVGALLLAVGLWFGLHGRLSHRLILRAYYRHAQNVKQGMPVCVDGVEVGSVTSVKVRPELGDRPVEVVVNLNTPHELLIPEGSTAQMENPGILRPPIVDIDTRGAHGSPIATGATIEGRESTDDQAAHALGVAVKALVDESQETNKRQKENKPADK
jgi:ABC-type transporter Mla subunit MlaD